MEWGTVAARTGFRRILFAGIVAVGAVASLAGCGSLPWDQNTPSAPPRTPTPAVTTPAPIVAVVNDLATGSATRQVTAGAITLSIDYYSTLSMDKWTAAANKPVTFNVKASLPAGSTQTVYMSKVTVLAGVTGPAGSLPAPPAFSDAATVSPGYLMGDNLGYQNTVTLPAIDPTATTVTLSFTYELLLKVAADSADVAKQTASDTLTIAVAAIDPTP